MANGETLDDGIDERGVPSSESLNSFLCCMIVE